MYTTKQFIAAVLVAFALPLPLLFSSHSDAKPGTVAMAKEFASEYLMTMFTVMDEPIIEGDIATFNVVILDRKCALTMQRAKTVDATNRSGWLMIHQSCVPTK
ncbi:MULTISPECIES: hypothetical protein [Pseudomonas]|uniref:hypothetical protein n=1 Tax=Pseudomonas TaxID=286 RepID=UPI000AF542E3|nr:MULTISPECIES: hypothetical protein [Pseudomonas]PWD02073.1 hypothetical protein CX658_19160 [Pseudomonas amygdali pv. lachrymans]WHS57466.1 hypothetical protein QLH64_31090 [Pseudomonas brassicacearum]WNZ87452.1 hypothetical protein QOM10_29655 [Pseudomonas sp. P108]